MELLFDTTGTAGNTELKDLLSFLDADLKFKKLSADIKTATGEVIDLIGKEIYELAVAAYKDTSISQEDKDFIYAVRYPIAIQAYRLFAPTGDVAHTNNGRKMRQDDGEKLPFEWLLDKSDKALEIRYYRALDEMIKFLDSTEDIELNTLWKDSEYYKMSRELFVHSTKVFSEVFPIESRLLYIKLTSGLKDCEDYHIKALVGRDKFNALKTALKSNIEIIDEKDLELIQLIKKATVFHAMAWSMPRYSVNLYPEGVLQHYTSDKATTKGAKPTLKSETSEAKQAFAADAEKALNAIQKLLEPAPVEENESNLIPNQMYGDKFFSA
jgi:hypothetical protein